jgi:hypothetical protein
MASKAAEWGLPRNYLAGNKRENFATKVGQILECYEHSENAAKRSKSYRNLGMASFRLLEFIPISE